MNPLRDKHFFNYFLPYSLLQEPFLTRYSHFVDYYIKNPRNLVPELNIHILYKKTLLFLRKTKIKKSSQPSCYMVIIEYKFSFRCLEVLTHNGRFNSCCSAMLKRHTGRYVHSFCFDCFSHERI